MESRQKITCIALVIAATLHFMHTPTAPPPAFYLSISDVLAPPALKVKQHLDEVFDTIAKIEETARIICHELDAIRWSNWEGLTAEDPKKIRKTLTRLHADITQRNTNQSFSDVLDLFSQYYIKLNLLTEKMLNYYSAGLDPTTRAYLARINRLIGHDISNEITGSLGYISVFMMMGPDPNNDTYNLLKTAKGFRTGRFLLRGLLSILEKEDPAIMTLDELTKSIVTSLPQNVIDQKIIGHGVAITAQHSKIRKSDHKSIHFTLHITVNCGAHPARLFSGNAGLIYRIIGNLYRNALDAMAARDPESTEITGSLDFTFALREIDGLQYFIISSDDSGIDFPEGYSLDTENTQYEGKHKLFGGMGIGLKAVKSLVESTGGKIEIFPGKRTSGTPKITIQLPVKTGPEVEIELLRFSA